MAYRYSDTYPEALGHAIQRKAAQGEQSMSLGFKNGSPDKNAAPEFTGDAAYGSLGARGAFGAAVNDPANQEAQRMAGDFMQRYLGGVFSPESGYA